MKGKESFYLILEFMNGILTEMLTGLPLVLIMR